MGGGGGVHCSVYFVMKGMVWIWTNLSVILAGSKETAGKTQAEKRTESVLEKKLETKSCGSGIQDKHSNTGKYKETYRI
jgi:hypothetical protein